MIAGQFGASTLLSAVQAAMVIPAEQGAVAKWWAEALQDFPLGGDDGLQVDAGTQTVDALDTTKNWRQGISDAVNDISFGIGCNRLVQRDPTTGLAGEVQSQDSLNRFPPTSLG